ncbi:MAG: HAMP domain-containing histidine kinase [Eubacteriaceae bacterium]|nr:HAMP domain-containing histidine kinase [Eubacteriaceae bacterium]
MKTRKLSLYWRLFFYLTVFLIVIIAIIWLIQLVFFESFYSISRRRQAASIAREMEARFAEYLQTGSASAEELQFSLDKISVSNEVCYVITNRYGMLIVNGEEVLGNCFIHMIHKDSFAYAEYFENAHRSGGIFEEFMDMRWYDEKKKADSYLYCKIISVGTNEFCLIINTTLIPMISTEQAIRSQLLWVYLAMLPLALCLAAFPSRAMSKPIAKMNNAAKSLAKGDYSAEFEESSIKEISELAQSLNYAASELAKVDKLRQELIANISHDLRTPLTMITGYAEMARDLPGEGSIENMQTIIDEAGHLSNLVNDMLDLSKLQAGSTKLQLTEFSLTSLIEEILQRFNAIGERENFKIAFAPDENIDVIADRSKIAQVIYNLLANAIAYTAKDKDILVTAKRIDLTHTRVEVIDNGQGIPEKMLPFIWERYYKVEKGHLKAEVGTGLGLSIVKSMLELHSAPFGVESEEGVGSVFWFEL